MIKTQIFASSNPLWQETLQQLRHDIYHLPEYLELEAKRTQSIPEAILIVEDKKIFFLPYLLRQCSDLFDGELEIKEVFDVVSPYGYPGILLNQAAASTPDFLKSAMSELTSVLKSRGVCSAFFRLHPILNKDFEEILDPDFYQVNGETVSINLKLSEAQIWSQTSNSRKNRINRCKRIGFTTRMVSLEQHINQFMAIYRETMERNAATENYYSFDSEYFWQLAKGLGEKIHPTFRKRTDSTLQTS